MAWNSIQALFYDCYEILTVLNWTATADFLLSFIEISIHYNMRLIEFNKFGNQGSK